MKSGSTPQRKVKYARIFFSWATDVSREMGNLRLRYQLHQYIRCMKSGGKNEKLLTAPEHNRSTSVFQDKSEMLK